MPATAYAANGRCLDLPIPGRPADRSQQPDINPIWGTSRQLRSVAKYEHQLVRLFAPGELDEGAIRQEAAKNRQRKDILERKRHDLDGQLKAVDRLVQGKATLAQFCDQVATQVIAQLARPVQDG